MTQATLDKIQALAAERKALMESLPTHAFGLSWCIEHTEIADRVVRVLFEDLQSQFDALPELAVIATGGFGRRELSPHSDIDITIVPSDEASPALDQAIRVLFQDLHSAFYTTFRMQVGYAYRLIADAPGLDATTRTGLMDMRLIVGSHELARQLEDAVIQSFPVGEFVLAKTTEREAMFKKYHGTPLVVEPHLKEGAGGIRCFHCANWIREAIGERAARPTSEYDYILRIRNLLHFNSGKHQDVLWRARQVEIADQLGQNVFEMMSEVVRCGDALHRHYRSAREKIHESKFPLANGVMAIHGEARIIGNADAGEAAAGIALATQLELKVSDLSVGTLTHVRGPAAAYALSTGEKTLRNLDRCGLLGQLLPDLDKCRYLVPDDQVHAFTVFEHTMRLIAGWDELEQDTFLRKVFDSVRDREPLYLAALLHDVGKIDPSQDHSTYGAELASEICVKWNLDVEVRETVEWLVREHLAMSKFIRLRDTANPQSVIDFAEIVKDPNRLALLTLLTWADINAVTPGMLTKTQREHLENLFIRTDALLRGEVSYSPDPAVYRQRLLRQFKSQQKDDQAVQDFIQSLPAYYLLSTPADVVRLHLEFAKKAIQGEPTVELFHRSDVNVTEITVCTLDAPGLLSKLLGVFYAFDLSVAAIRACTTMTETPVALDVFTVSFSGRPVPSATTKQVTAAVLGVLDGSIQVDALLSQRGKDPSRTQPIFHHTFVEGTPGILELRCPRGRGMPFRASRLIAGQDWNVVSARVGQWADTATAAFYVLGPNGAPLHKEDADRVFGPITDAH